MRDECCDLIGPFAVDRLTDRIDHSADQGFADGDFRNAAGALDRIAFFDSDIVAHQHGAHVVFLQVQGNAI